jgi:hypothetical protein
VLPGQVNAQGAFAGFDSPIRVASAKSPLDVKANDLNGDATADIVAVESSGIRVIFGQQPIIPPNNTPQTARNLGTVVHLLEPTLTLVPGHEDAWYTLTVPTEAARGAGEEVLDFSGLFEARRRPASPWKSATRRQSARFRERFRIRARRGRAHTHVFGDAGPGGVRGSGAYTLDIDVLPQVVSIEAQALLPGVTAAPGGPTASLVLTFQGDRLDPDTAQNRAHYRVTWLGPDGLPDTADDQMISISSGGQGVVYSPSSNGTSPRGRPSPRQSARPSRCCSTDRCPPAPTASRCSPPCRPLRSTRMNAIC